MSAFKGGRGHPAPYETTHVRVPLPIKFLVDRLIENYRNYLSDSSQFEPNFIALSQEKIEQIAKEVIAESRPRDRAEVRRRVDSFIKKLLVEGSLND